MKKKKMSPPKKLKKSAAKKKPMRHGRESAIVAKRKPMRHGREGTRDVQPKREGKTGRGTITGIDDTPSAGSSALTGQETYETEEKDDRDPERSSSEEEP
jgi:hypothetical protein